MKSLGLVLCGLILLIVGCNRNKGGDIKLPVDTDASLSAATQAQQARIAGAFYGALVPKMKTCWGTVEGKGEVEFKMTYKKAGERWEWQGAEVAKSDLSDKAKAAAQDCLQTSARASGFPVNGNESAARIDRFVITWGFPVPFPDNTSDLAMMISTGGGSGECRKTCFDCQESSPGVPGTTKCVTTCSGYETCKEDGTGNGCQMTPVGGGSCATGWSGVWQGGYIASKRDGIRF
jgi:hypothetical protein